MYEGKTRTLFFRYAVPQMVGLLFNSIYTIVDGVFIGNLSLVYCYVCAFSVVQLSVRQYGSE